MFYVSQIRNHLPWAQAFGVCACVYGICGYIPRQSSDFDLADWAAEDIHDITPSSGMA